MNAFDKVPHQRLLRIMERSKISETVIKWKESFLNDRKQKVTVNGAESMVSSAKRYVVESTHYGISFI
jgi:hypothetical protein